MNILYICKLYSVKGNGVIGAIQTEIEGIKEFCEVGILNFGSSFKLSNFNNIYEANKYKEISELPSPFNNPDLVIFEEIYKWEYIKLYKKLKKNNIPYIIIPHGSLVKKEQHRKFLKKIIANNLFFNSFIYNAEAIQFLNEQEKNNSNFKIKKSIIIPNSVSIQNKDSNNIDKKTKLNNNKFIYIGRYSIYTKGLDLLVKMCKKYRNELEKMKVKFDIYGRIDKDSQKDYKTLKKEIEKNQLNDLITLNDAIYGYKKHNVMYNSNFFIQLSRHEGQPMGIIEALSFGLPCIITYATSFGTYCENNKCGIAVEENIDSIYNGICKMINLSKKEVMLFSNNAKKSSIKDFSIETVGKETFLQYNRIVNSRE